MRSHEIHNNPHKPELLIYLTGLPTVSTGFGGTTNPGNIANISCKVIGAYSSVFWEHQYNGVTSIVNTSVSSKYSGGSILIVSNDLQFCCQRHW